MKYQVGDCLSFRITNSKYLAGFVNNNDGGQYYIAMTDFCKDVPVSGDYFDDCLMFATRYETNEMSVSSLDVVTMAAEYVDNNVAIEKTKQLEVPGFISSGGFAPIGELTALADYFDSGLKLRSQVDQQFVIACFINIVEIFRASTPVNEFPVVNLFKDIDDVSWYWQIYGSSVEPANLVIHWGKFGEYGEHKEIRNKPIEELREIYNKGLLEKQSEGYTRAEKYQRMILQFPVEGWGDTSDLDFRNEVWECVEPYIHWSVNGYVSGGDIGGGTINIFLGVISPEYAVHVITKVLEQKNIKRPYLIALELDESSGEEGDGFGVKVLYPNDFQGSFSY